MRVLTALIVLVLALLLAWFSAANWVPVAVRLWPPYELVVRLPVLMVLCVLAGWLPSAMWNSAARWRLQRRLAQAERALETSRAGEPAPAPQPGAPSPVVPLASL